MKTSVVAILAFSCLATSPVLAKPGTVAPPGAAGAAGGAIDPAAAISALLRRPQFAVPTRPALSSKAALAGAAGVDASDLSTPTVLSLARPRVGRHTLKIQAMSWNDPDTGAAVFLHHGGAAIVTVDTMPNRTYVVECTGGVGPWTMLRYDRRGDEYAQVQETVAEGTGHPVFAFTADEYGTTAVVFMPAIVDQQPQLLYRCQVASTQLGGK